MYVQEQQKHECCLSTLVTTSLNDWIENFFQRIIPFPFCKAVPLVSSSTESNLKPNNTTEEAQHADVQRNHKPTPRHNTTERRAVSVVIQKAQVVGHFWNLTREEVKHTQVSVNWKQSKTKHVRFDSWTPQITRIIDAPYNCWEHPVLHFYFLTRFKTASFSWNL